MSSENDVVIDVRGVSKTFRVEGKGVEKGASEAKARVRADGAKRNTFQALDDVSFQVRRGETVGIVGRNGAGKSTLLKIISGMMQPDSGEVELAGQAYSVMSMGAGFQRNLSGAENIHIKGAVMGASSSEIRKKIDWIVDFSELGDYIHQPMRTYSKGMTQRLAFAITFAFDPKLLIIDEALSGGDMSIKRKAEARLNEIKDSGATILLVSHGGAHHKRLCDRSILLDKGRILNEGPPQQVLSYYDRILSAAPDELEAAIEAVMAADPVQDALRGRAEETAAAAGVERGFDPSLKSRSVHASEPRGARIVKGRFVDPETGQDVNLLEQGRRYRFEVDVAFEKAVKEVEARMSVKAEDGTVLFSMTLPAGKRGKRKFAEGDLHTYKFPIRNRLLPETYFIDIALTGRKGLSSGGLHRVSDIVMFKVFGDAPDHVSGLVDLMK